jgi:pilus assembly protein CpaB
MAARRYSLVFYVAILVAAAATYGVWRVIESTKASSRVATAPVVVAARDINEGERIDRIALSVAQWPVATVPVGAYGRVDSVAGRVAKVPIFNGEPMVPGRLAPEGTDAGLASKITPGKRAFSIRVNDVSGIAGLIQPNSRVDILLTTTLANGERASKTFMSNMRVLGMQQSVHKSEDGRPIPATVAHLDVTPEEGELLGVAQAQGTIQLMLRGYGDPDSVVTKGATSRDVQNTLRNAPVRTIPQRSASNTRITPPPVVAETVMVPVPAARPARPDTARIEVFRGGAKSEVKFQKDTTKRDTLVRRDTLSRN